MKSKFEFIDSELGQIKKNHLLRTIRYSTISGSSITIKGKKLLNLCSNDYLGIPSTKLDVEQMQSSSRLVSGNDESYWTLEKKLARHKSQEASLVYPTGYMANMGIISTIAKKGDLIVSDELNHASVIESCRLSGARVSIFKHNHMKDLQGKLKQKAGNKFVITEGIFSMDGDFSKLREITELAETSNAITILDDAHGDFIVGKNGRGTASHFGVCKKIDVYISSLSKGLGSFGGYVASQKKVIDFCVNRSKSFIYTSALPSSLVKHSLIRLEMDKHKNRKTLQENTKLISKGLEEIGYAINSETQIIPIIIGQEKTTLEFGQFLFNHGVYAQPIRYPTVPKNKARIRLSVTAWLTKNEIENSLSVFDKAYSKFIK